MNIRGTVQEFIPAMDSHEKVYGLFRILGYPDGKLLDPTYKRKIEDFDFAREEREKVKDIFTVFNYDGKLQIFLIETKTLSTPLVRYLAKRLSDRYLNFLLILTADYKGYTFIFPEFERIEEGRHKLKLTRLIFDRQNAYHTDLLTISNLVLAGEAENWRDIWRRWKDAFSVEKVTDRFFDEYKKAFFKLRKTFESQEIPVKHAHELALQCLSRLMFLYFVSKKRWLNNDPKFIKWYWHRYKEEKRNGRAKEDIFYENWLRILFLEAFNNQYSHPHFQPKDVNSILANAPYLNGGLFNSVQAHFPCIQKMDKKSDYYIYFYFHGLALLNDKGTFCFITSNSWLDVGYGKDLQEFLLKYCHIKAIYDNQSKRSFEHADVNTIIALFSAPDVNPHVGAIHELPRQNIARFIMFKRPFEEVINTKNLLEIEKAKDIVKTDAYRVFPVKQETLLEEGWEYPVDAIHELHLQKPKQKSLIKDKFLTGKYDGNKWGGKYLRAPDIFFTILEKGKGKLVRLGDIAEVRFGIKTGCNEFFYLPSKHFDIRKEGKYYEFIPKYDGLPKGIRIEEEYLQFAFLSPRDVETLNVKSSILKKHLLMLNAKHKPSNGLKSYLQWGEQQKINKRPSCRSRDKWWAIAGRPACPLACNYLVNDYMRFYFSQEGMWVSDNFQEIHISKNMALLSIYLNSIVSQFFINMSGRSNFGGGLLKIQTYEVSDLLTISTDINANVNEKMLKNIFNAFSEKCNLSLYEQCGFNHDFPIREQTPNPLPDRRALDDVVFDILGLTQDERNEVYWAVCALVKNRLDKARSV